MQSTESETVLLRPGMLAAPVGCPVRWCRSTRARRVSLRIDPRAGEVIVTLPMREARRAGMALLTTHAAWVMQRLAALAPAVSLAPGAEVLLGGRPHVICHDPSARGGAFLEGATITVTGQLEFLARRVKDFLRAEAKRRIAVLADGHAATLGVKIRAIRLKDTRSRWGSCAPDGTLAFSWRLVMAPDWVLDYVVAHEVAHLRELNHSPRFWAHVETLAPDREAAQDWLRDNGPALLRVG
ncbi:M48 family metallopeptidase [Roseomonas terrae]|uniref:M48 family metallopeptidase n=1 Tax=Neoroseomonas terrae TaxID=424799 RepID=A0ABS5EBP7_9PROT|nr:SprT family zinc-dependent metalloprotease [Neoroseomonas terrae]MBR0648444.1 M48 family metallopeptidase [Neoroseomonas terrae]